MPEITEGLATTLFEPGKVFYNPVQQFNRDTSVVAIRAWANQSRINDKELKEGQETKRPKRERYIDIIEALSATGLRAIRYAKEIPEVRQVVANDMSASAVAAIARNVQHNQVEQLVVANKADANTYMHEIKKKRAHIVDLDPYGSATPFMDAAVQAVEDGGMLCVTCTDLGTLAGKSYPEKCFAQYGGAPVNSNDVCHEAALRLVLHMVASTAARYGRSIEPLLSLSIDFYVRLFIRVRTSPAQVKFNHSKTMLVYHCTGCKTVDTFPLGRTSIRETTGSTKHSPAPAPSSSTHCRHCNTSTNHIAGPMWGGPLHDKSFIDQMLAIHATLDNKIYGTLPRMKGMLVTAQSELDTPFFVSLPQTAQIAKVACPPMTMFASTLLNAGYKVSETHCKDNSIKTDAPNSFIWAVFRKWVAQQRAEGKLEGNGPKIGSPGYGILRNGTDGEEATISFDNHHEATKLQTHRKKTLRFQMNPTDNWGPKARASKN